MKNQSSVSASMHQQTENHSFGNLPDFAKPNSRRICMALRDPSEGCALTIWSTKGLPYGLNERHTCAHSHTNECVRAGLPVYPVMLKDAGEGGQNECDTQNECLTHAPPHTCRSVRGCRRGWQAQYGSARTAIPPPPTCTQASDEYTHIGRVGTDME